MRNTLRQLATIALIAGLSGCATQRIADFEPPVYPPAPNEPRFYWQEVLAHNGHVEIEDRDKAMERLLTGSPRPVKGMAKPFDVTVFQGKVYVTDNVAREVVVFDRPGKRFFTFGKTEEVSLVQPFAIDHDMQGNIYVIDGSLKEAIQFDSEGNFIARFGNPDEFSRPSGIAVNPEGTKLFITDTGGVQSPPEHHRVRVYDIQSGDHLFDIGGRGNDNGKFNLPKNIAVNQENELFVNDSANFRIQVFDASTGEFIRTFGGIGRRSGQFARPKGLALDNEGYVYVTDTAFGNFQIFNAEGDLMLYVGERNSAGGPGQFMLPSGLAIDEDGRVYMVDQYFSKVTVFRPAAVPADGGYFAVNPKK